MSIFTVTVVVVLVLPALSVQVPETMVPAVSALSVVDVVHDSTPLGPLSPAEAKETVTLVLFQPLALGAGVADTVGAFGADASRLMVTDALFVPPALVAEHVNVVLPVSTVTLEGSQPVEDEIDDWGSVTVHVRPRCSCTSRCCRACP